LSADSYNKSAKMVLIDTISRIAFIVSAAFKLPFMIEFESFSASLLALASTKSLILVIVSCILASSLIILDAISAIPLACLTSTLIQFFNASFFRTDYSPAFN